MDRVEFKELHITSVYFWAQIFLIFILIEENVHNFIFESKKMILAQFFKFLAKDALQNRPHPYWTPYT